MFKTHENYGYKTVSVIYNRQPNGYVIRKMEKIGTVVRIKEYNPPPAKWSVSRFQIHKMGKYASLNCYYLMEIIHKVFVVFEFYLDSNFSKLYCYYIIIYIIILYTFKIEHCAIFGLFLHEAFRKQFDQHQKMKMFSI